MIINSSQHRIIKVGKKDVETAFKYEYKAENKEEAVRLGFLTLIMLNPDFFEVYITIFENMFNNKNIILTEDKRVMLSDKAEELLVKLASISENEHLEYFDIKGIVEK